jgi:UDP-2-acetamido-3-amino-2,3-dideoxy-glucuronate N-acetyltransferase
VPDGPVVHETATVEPGASIGDGTVVWHHAHVRRGARIGDGCVIGKGVYVDEGVSVGDRAKIQNNVSVYRGVRLDDEVFVGPGAVFTNDRYPRAVGDWDVSETTVQRGASIGANATVVCGVGIGRYATVAAGAVVTRDVGDHELVAGNPARRLGWVCRCGRVLARTPGPFPPSACASCGAAYEGGPA